MDSERAIALLRDRGLRITASRRAVVTALLQAGEHFTAEDLLQSGRRLHPALGRSTVYRTLETCTSLGLVRPLALGSAELFYVRPGDGHHHLVCTECSRCFEFDDCAVEGLAPRLEERFDFVVRGHLLELYGLCADCRGA